jgi:molybdenum cofactor cytidylyltransferase
MKDVWAIVLAAGESTRMKANKLLLPWEGVPMIGAVIDRIRASGAEGILVVLGAYRDEMLDVLDSRYVTTCYNADYREGMLSSVRCGFKNLPAEASAALVFLGDQPMVAPEVTGRLVEAWRASGKGICLPVFGGRRGHPVLIDRKYREEIDHLDPEVGLKGLMHGHPDDILEVESGGPAILRDIDTPADYEKETRNLKKYGTQDTL